MGTPFHISEPDTAAEARQLHALRQLSAAADHRASLFDALGLSPLALDLLDEAIATLDELDGDADFEPWLGCAHFAVGISAVPLDAEREDEHDEDGCDDEHSLGAPERHPHVFTMGDSLYEPGNGSYRLVRSWESQASWAQGTRLEGEREAEAGYCLPEGDGSKHGEDDDDQLSNGEHDRADDEPFLGALEHVGQLRWAAGDRTDAELDGTDCIDRRKSLAQAEAAWARRPALNALAAKARALRRSQAVPCDPDALIIIQPGVAWWHGPALRNCVPVPGRIVSALEPNLVEIAL